MFGDASRIGWLGALAMCLGGCANQAFSPPTGWVPAEEPVPLAPGERRIGGGIGIGDIGLDAADISGGNVRYRQGLSELLELQAEGALVVITEETREFPGILSGRVGLKGGFSASLPHLGWTAGLGLGGSAGGVFTAADVGLQLGYVNPYLTPWIGLSAIASVPITSEEVDLAREDDEEPILDHPVTTFGARFSLGLTAHLGDSRSRLHVAFANLRLYDIHGEDESVSALSLGFDVPF